MHFEEDYLYHIYNQGNNKQRIFFNRENYLFFLKKTGVHVKPHCDILAWVLMPNHFHLMVRVRRLNEGFAQSETLVRRTLNQSIGIMLRSYTNAINKQEARSGSLFRKKTKSLCLNYPDEISPSYFDSEIGTQIYQDLPQYSYPQVCFDYIHQNPVKAGLVKRDVDWEFSSARDYAGLRNGNLINKDVALFFGLIF